MEYFKKHKNNSSSILHLPIFRILKIQFKINFFPSEIGIRKIIGLNGANEMSSLIKQAINTSYSPTSKNREPILATLMYFFVDTRRIAELTSIKTCTTRTSNFLGAPGLSVSLSLQFHKLATQTTLLG